MTDVNISLTKVAALMIGGLLPLAAGLAHASAETFDWSITGPSSDLGGVVYTGSGTLVTSNTSVPGGVGNTQSGYLVTGITGTLDGSAITGLLPVGTFAGNDNLVFPISSSLLDPSGLAFTTKSGIDVDLFGFYEPGSTDVTSGYNYAETASPSGFGVGTFTLTEAPVPEPASMALLAAGLCGLPVIRRRAWRLW
jgi:hypothetical protein